MNYVHLTQGHNLQSQMQALERALFRCLATLSAWEEKGSWRNVYVQNYQIQSTATMEEMLESNVKVQSAIHLRVLYLSHHERDITEF